MNGSTHVQDLMSTPPVFIDIGAAPSAVQATLEGNAFHHLPVLDRGVLVGVVSAVDLARVSLGVWVQDPKTEAAWMDSNFRIADLMTWEPVCCRVDDPVKLAADKLSDGAFHCLPVLDREDRLVGMLTSTDLLRWMVNS